MSEKFFGRLVKNEFGAYEEQRGLYYEEFDVGDRYVHRPGRTITEADNVWMSMLCGNNHPLHIDNEYARRTEFGRTLVSSLVTFSILGGLSLSSTSARGVANLGWKEVNLSKPVFVGDTLRAETTVLAKRLSKSRLNQGIVTVKTAGYNQMDELCISWERSFLVPCHSKGEK